MIEHLRQREKALEQFGWAGREAEWIALVGLHSGVFTRAQFCHYFDTDRKRALRFVKALVERRQAVENETLVFSGGAKPCRIYPASRSTGHSGSSISATGERRTARS